MLFQDRHWREIYIAMGEIYDTKDKLYVGDLMTDRVLRISGMTFIS